MNKHDYVFKQLHRQEDAFKINAEKQKMNL